MIEDILKSKYGKFLKGLDIYENKTSLILSRIIINDEFKGEGIGTKVMKDLVDYAEKNNQIIALTPSSDFGGNKNRLIQFYKRFGFKHNKGIHKSYEFRDSMIRYPKNLSESMKKETIKGGLGDGMSIVDLAIHHGKDSWASIQFESLEKQLQKQLDKGVKIEKEHTKSLDMAREIAMDHLYGDPKYYDKLETIEESTQKQFIRKLIRENIKLMVTDETPDTTTYDIYYKDRSAGTITCGPAPMSLGEDTKEIVSLNLDDDYTNINVANQAVKALWNAHKKTNRLVINIPSASHLFWEKLGFQRLNDTFHMLMRGH